MENYHDQMTNKQISMERFFENKAVAHLRILKSIYLKRLVYKIIVLIIISY